MSALAIVGSTGNSVAGCSYALNSDSPTVAAAKQRRRHVASLLLAIKALSFNQFESFCARVLILMGAATAQITPHAGDQGIDFYGHLTLGQLNGMPAPFMRLMHDVKLAFVGQAKHYPAQNLGPNVVRELVGAVSLARSRTFSASDVSAFDDADLKPFSPCVILLFTTGGISRGARQLAESAGVIVRSGEQLAVFLADHGVAMTDVNGDQFFDPAAFAAWVSTELRPG
jgi:restriction endonuclease Mrr